MKIPAAQILKIMAVICTMTAACCKVEPEPEVKDRILLYYGAGFNDLSAEISADISQLCSSDYIPEKSSGNVLLVFQNLAEKNYSTPYTPVLYRVYRNRSGETVKETLLTLEPGTIAASVSTLNRVLSHIKSTFVYNTFGMIFSSHATGWLPAAGNTENPSGKTVSPLSIGNEFSPETGTKVQYEMDLDDFADAIPMHLDYILFDACFMGGVEVAYELKDVCDRLVFSSEEILADGMVYTDIVRRLLEENPANLTGVAEDYFYHYNSMTGWQQSGLISTVRCSGLDALADACAMIYTNHRGQIPAIPASQVQKLNYNDPSYFYDLRDALEQLGLSDTEKEALDKALEECVEYSAHTEYFFKGKSYGYRIETFCGLSTYLPSAVSITNTRERLNEYYKGYKWNQATHWISD